ncbi:hypothetical protein [Hyalangium rubrum]|uniref:Uncharacterized protein n=1 Tax=Hyalangium rubrum TaxID=3103134 RepID=A0ABU5HI34_9BACT|nr:hypothetical protein [Hyalangium sp. s54d21]MDY7233120.1 hypothetical protein [Hyalangium sp. s54d21]
MKNLVKPFLSLVSTLAFAAALFLNGQAQAAQPLNLESLAWQATGPGTVTSTPDSGPADSMAFDYFLNGPAVWSPQQWTFTATAPQTATLNLDWTYFGFHAWFMVHANAQAFADGPNGRTYAPLYSRNYGDVWSVTGTASLQLHEGYAFGFIIDGQNFDSDSRLLGNLKITARFNLESQSWQASGPGTVTMTPDSGPADSMAFDYFLNGSAVWSPQQWTFAATASHTTLLNFDWTYFGFHAWFMVYANAQAFADGPNGRTYAPLYSRNYGDVWSVNGTASLQLHAGYPFGFIIDGQNFDSDSRLLGNLKITAKP